MVTGLYVVGERLGDHQVFVNTGKVLCLAWGRIYMNAFFLEKLIKLYALHLVMLIYVCYTLMKSKIN